MKEELSREELIQLILTLANDVITAKGQLTDLDALIGDGDLGVTMTLGFNAVKESLGSLNPSSLQEVLRAAGMAFADKAASTFGTLVSAMFMRAGDAVKGRDAIKGADVAAMLRAAAEQAVKDGKTLLDCLDAALEVAKQGAENTVNMRSQAGRSSWFGDRTVGTKDPGAAALVIMLESVVRSVRSVSG